MQIIIIFFRIFRHVGESYPGCFGRPPLDAEIGVLAVVAQGHSLLADVTFLLDSVFGFFGGDDISPTIVPSISKVFFCNVFGQRTCQRRRRRPLPLLPTFFASFLASRTLLQWFKLGWGRR